MHLHADQYVVQNDTVLGFMLSGLLAHGI
uniref:Uncharacterized protein n=1 Tax=Anguilla anguilla TaxID=7936 RepID=A0A0E9R0T6_ANGAN